jgi:hypothetical protein
VFYFLINHVKNIKVVKCPYCGSIQKPYQLGFATKCKQGYAVNYRLGETNGRYIISADGKMLADYAILDK